MEDLKPLSLDAGYFSNRKQTESLVSGLTPEDMQIQSMEDVSPTKWHLAHTTWFWETFLLKPHLPGYSVFNDAFCFLFNSYYEGVGSRHPRAERGLLSRPGVDEILAYRRHVDTAMGKLLSRAEGAEWADLVWLGIAHEQQHQELILTDIKHVLGCHPHGPAVFNAPANDPDASSGGARWQEFEGGLYQFGAHAGDGFHFDNEGPRHEAVLTPFALADRAVTNGEFAEFIADGGYATATLWLSDGWAQVKEKAWEGPLYWRRTEAGQWLEYTLAGLRALELDAPVTHVSYYEAAAFAEWAGARLPDEREWELAAISRAGPDGRFAKAGVAPQPGPARTGQGCRQMFGDVWEWTRSAYSPYPRFRPASGAVGEYNGKFMSGQQVLRGGSCATPSGHVRASYRNFFPPGARWQFSGIRLARDV
ncbi:ergothioneine biosynthesis protein EgtB [Maricaulis sp. CAU 1757]